MKTKNAIKRSMALLCSLMLMFTLCLSASAHTSSPTLDGTTTGSLTINKTDGAGTPITDTNLEYTIYKVADAVQTNAAGVVSLNYILDAGITLNSGTVVGDGLTVAMPTGTTAASFDAASLPAGTALTNAAGTGTLTFSGLSLGLYLVRETVTPAGATQPNDFLVSIPQNEIVGGVQQWNYDPVAAPKNTVVDGTVTKGITSGATLVSGSTYTASLGDMVSYAVQVTMPSTFTVTPYTTYAVTDTPDKDLIIDLDAAGAAGSFNGIVVSVGGTPLVSGTDYIISAVAATATTSAGFKIEFITAAPTGTTPGVQSAALVDGAVVDIAYNAQLSPTATTSSFANAVQVDSVYNTPGGTVTPPPIEPPPTTPPTVVTYNYALQKVDDASTPAPLPGAKFAIKDSTGTNYLTWDDGSISGSLTPAGWGTTTNLSDPLLYTFTSAAATNGIVPFNGLAGGSYQIVELAAPTGYTQLTTPIVVTIDQTTTDDADTSIVGSNGYSIQVVNSLASSIPTLPNTGGMGIYLYTIGGVLLIGAAIFLFARRKKSNV